MSTKRTPPLKKYSAPAALPMMPMMPKSDKKPVRPKRAAPAPGMKALGKGNAEMRQMRKGLKGGK